MYRMALLFTPVHFEASVNGRSAAWSATVGNARAVANPPRPKLGKLLGAEHRHRML